MDFFEHQDVARRKSWLLTFYFVMAVLCMIVSLYLVAIMVIPLAETYLQSERDSGYSGRDAGFQLVLFRPFVFLGVTAVTLGIIGIGSLYKTSELRAGGSRVASMLGGRRINPNTRDPAERRLLNVVEEMALASGIPVPPVFVLDREMSINAFAAGYTPGDAVIGVNRGTLEYLNRDELQGVMAHEFSHILHGDMRLNIRLIGILHGILLFSVVGYYVMYYTALSGGGRSRGRKNGGGGLMLAMIVLGLAAMVIGYIGLFFARLIKAGVSRQREYLADASAVQFTRNPDGIAGALKKIGGLAQGSRVESPEAETASHMFFGSALKTNMVSAFATHPPLVDRIKRVDPNFDGRFPRTTPYREVEQPVQAQVVETKPEPGMVFRSPMEKFRVFDAIPVEPIILLDAVGEPTTGTVSYSHDLIASLPQQLLDAIHDVFSARSVVFALLLDEEGEIRDNQLRLLHELEGEPTERESLKLEPLIRQQGDAARLPIVEMVQGTLVGMSREQYQRFHKTVDELVKADGKINLFEFVTQRVLLEHLDRHILEKRPPRAQYHSLNAVLPETVGLISCLAHVGHSSITETKAAFEQALSDILASGRSLELLPKQECSLRVVSSALAKLSQGSPSVKKRVLDAAMRCVAADGKVTVAEAELLRAIADSLDCPLPPIGIGPVAPTTTSSK